MDISKYGIRVIRTEPVPGRPSGAISSTTPIDIEGTALKLVMPSLSASHAIKQGKWFDVFFGGHVVYAYIRWDNDKRGTLPVSILAICSFGTLPMCWPLNAPSKEELAHRFDFRRAEERCPRTAPLKLIKSYKSFIDSIGNSYETYKLNYEGVVKSALTSGRVRGYSRASTGSFITESIRTYDASNYWLNSSTTTIDTTG